MNLGGCVYLRIEDVISNPSKTFSISDLEPPKISQKADFEEIPAFEKDIDEILFENKAVKKFLQKHQYHLSEVGNGVFPGTIWFRCILKIIFILDGRKYLDSVIKFIWPSKIKPGLKNWIDKSKPVVTKPLIKIHFT